MAEQNPNPAAPGGHKKVSWTPILLVITFILVVIVSLPTVILSEITHLDTLSAS